MRRLYESFFRGRFGLALPQLLLPVLGASVAGSPSVDISHSSDMIGSNRESVGPAGSRSADLRALRELRSRTGPQPGIPQDLNLRSQRDRRTN